MSVVMIPPDAVHFWLEVAAPDGSWLRLDDDERLGGKWWTVGTATPEHIAHLAGGDAALTYRATFTKKDRRQKIGTSPPFQVAAPAGDDDGADPPIEEDPDPSAPQPLPPRIDPPRTAAPRTTTARRVNGANGQGLPPPVPIQPKVAMPFTPPPNDPDLARFVFLRSLAQQDTDRFLTMVLSFHQAEAEAARNRSREAIESTRAYFGSIERNQRELQAVMLAANKGNEVPLVVRQMQEQMAAQTQAIALVGNKLEEYDQADDAAATAAAAAMSENPNNVERVFHGIQGILSAVANSPLAEPLAEMMRRSSPEQQPPPQPAQYDQQPYESETKEGYDQQTGEVDEGFDNDAPPVQ